MLRFSVQFTALALLLVGLPAGCSSKPTTETTAKSDSSTEPALRDRDPQLAKRLVDEGALLIDVRTPEEYAERHIDGAENFPVQTLSNQLDAVDASAGGDKERAIVLYCGSGARADRAKAILTEAGYKRITNMGGIDAWPKD